MEKPIRHIVSLSGGKDSTALAVFMKKQYPEIPVEYVFCDTGEELKETYEYLEKVETFLGKSITRLRADRTWQQFLEQFSGYLPAPRNRWCTVKMKIMPFEKFVGENTVISYIGIRADENREGYISSKPNIQARYPFKEHGITKDDVMRLLEESGLGLPDYYAWRSRSGCYFCFFQRRFEWLGLKERHPDLFEKAKTFETINADGSAQNFTWNQGVDLETFTSDAEGIRKRHEENTMRVKKQKMAKSTALVDVFSAALDMEAGLNAEDDSEGCLVCHL